MRVNMDQLSNDAHVWIFGISPSLDAQKSDALLGQINAFLEKLPGVADGKSLSIPHGQAWKCSALERRDNSKARELKG